MWCGWRVRLAAPLVRIHQLEEYSLPVIGLRYHSPTWFVAIRFCAVSRMPDTHDFYPVVNISLMWFGAPLAATSVDATSSLAAVPGD